MEENQVYTIILRHDTSANWMINDPVLALGEYGVEDDTHRVKRGDGQSKWSELTYDTFGLEYMLTFENIEGDVTDNKSLQDALNQKLSVDTFEDSNNSVITSITLKEETGKIGRITKVSKNVKFNNTVTNYIDIISKDNSINGIWSIDNDGVNILNLQAVSSVENYAPYKEYKINQLCFYNNGLYRCIETHIATPDLDKTKWITLSSLNASDINFNPGSTSLKSKTVKNALQELSNKVDSKVEQTTQPNKIYGTNGKGEQILLSKDDLGKVDSVNNINPDENKNVTIEAKDIQYDSENSTLNVKQAIDTKANNVDVKEQLNTKIDKDIGDTVVTNIELSKDTDIPAFHIVKVGTDKKDKTDLFLHIKPEGDLQTYIKNDGIIVDSTNIDNKINELQTGSSELENSIEQVNAKVDKNTTSINELKTTTGNLKNSIDTLEANVDNVENQVDSLNTKVTDIEENITNLNTETQKQIETINTEITSIKEVNTQQTEDIKTITQSIDEVNTKIDTKVQELQQKDIEQDEKLNNINTVIETINTEITDVQKDIVQINKDIDNVELTNSEQDEKLNILDTEITNLKNKDTDLQSQIDEINDSQIVQDTDVQDIKKQLESINTEIDTINEKDTEQDTNISNIQTDITEYKSQMQTTIESLQQKDNTLDSKDKEIEAEIETIKTDITNLQDYDDIQDQNINANTQSITELTEKHNTDIKALQDKDTILENKNIEQDQRLSSVENKNTEQDNKLTQIEQTQTQLDTNIKEALQDITDLDNKVEGQLEDIQQIADDQATMIESINNSVSIINNTITNIKNKDTEQDKAIDNLTTKVNSNNQILTEEIKSINTLNQQQSQQISDINSSISDLNSSIMNINDTVADINASNAHLDQKVTSMANELTAATENNTRQDQEITELDTKLQELQEKVSEDETITDGELQQINTKLDELDVELQQINTNVSTNTENIELNTGKITDLESRVDTAEENITTNTQNINKNTQDITTNTQSIETLNTKIETKLDKDFANNVNKELVSNLQISPINTQEEAVTLFTIEQQKLNVENKTSSTSTLTFKSTDNTILATPEQDESGNITSINLATNLNTDVNYFITSQTLDETIGNTNTIPQNTITAITKEGVEVEDIITDSEGTWSRVQSIDDEQHTVTTITFQRQKDATWGTIQGTLSNQQDLQTALNNKLDKTFASGELQNNIMGSIEFSPSGLRNGVFIRTKTINPTNSQINTFESYITSDTKQLTFTPGSDGIDLGVNIENVNFDNSNTGLTNNKVGNVLRELKTLDNAKVTTETFNTFKTQNTQDINNAVQTATQSITEAYTNADTALKQELQQADNNLQQSITDLQNNKLDKNQGTSNTGKHLIVDENGLITPQTYTVDVGVKTVTSDYNLVDNTNAANPKILQDTTKLDKSFSEKYLTEFGIEQNDDQGVLTVKTRNVENKSDVISTVDFVGLGSIKVTSAYDEDKQNDTVKIDGSEIVTQITNGLNTKVDKVTTPSVLYGVSADGQQTTYSTTEIGSVNSVNGVEPQKNTTNILIDATQINIDESQEEKQTIKEVVDNKLDKVQLDTVLYGTTNTGEQTTYKVFNNYLTNPLVLSESTQNILRFRYTSVDNQGKETLIDRRIISEDKDILFVGQKDSTDILITVDAEQVQFKPLESNLTSNTISGAIRELKTLVDSKVATTTFETQLETINETITTNKEEVDTQLETINTDIGAIKTNITTLNTNKLDKVTTPSVLYGTTSDGQQTTYSTNDLGKVETVNSIAPDENKNILIDGTNINVDEEAETKVTIKNALNTKLDKVTKVNKIYGTNTDGEQTTYTITKQDDTYLSYITNINVTDNNQSLVLNIARPLIETGVSTQQQTLTLLNVDKGIKVDTENDLTLITDSETIPFDTKTSNLTSTNVAEAIRELKTLDDSKVKTTDFNNYKTEVTQDIAESVQNKPTMLGYTKGTGYTVGQLVYITRTDNITLMALVLKKFTSNNTESNTAIQSFKVDVDNKNISLIGIPVDWNDDLTNSETTTTEIEEDTTEDVEVTE